jgi:protein-S-isoprenylcysteine O-methyltransferase
MHKNARKLIQGFFVTLLIVIVPATGNLQILRAPHLWFLIVIGLLGSLFQPQYNPFRPAPDNKDRGTANQIIWSVYVTQLAAILEASYMRYPASVSWSALTTIALLLMIAGLLIRTWAVFTLGGYFTWHITVEKNQRVVKSGPYAYIRHPGYLGALITYVSTPLFLHAWISLAVCAIILPAAFVRRIYHEEAELKRELGSEYESYSESVKRLFPGIW